MAFPSINPTQTNAWSNLLAHFQEVKDLKMQDFFAEDHNRVKDFSLEWNDFFVDLSKNRITGETISLLLDLTKEVRLKEAIDAQFSGEHINQTENRAVGHTLLRNFNSLPLKFRKPFKK